MVWRLTVIDASDALAPRQIAATDAGDLAATEVFLDSGVLYLVETSGRRFDQPETSQLRLLDVTALPQLREIGRLAFGSQAESRGIALAGRRLCLPGSQRPIQRMFEGEWPEDLLTVELTDPTQPRALGFVPLDAYAKDITVVGDTAYSAAGRDPFRFNFQTGESLLVLPGFADPAGPRARWSVSLPAVPRTVAVRG